MGFLIPNSHKAKVFRTREDAYEGIKVFSSWRDDLKRGVIRVFSEDELNILNIIR